MIRNFVKKIYMLCFHPYLFLKNRGKNLFIKRHFDINNRNKIQFGNKNYIGYNARIRFCEENARLILQDNVYISNNNTFLLGEDIEIGKSTILASYICITSENHGMDAASDIPYKDQSLLCNPVKIGDACWIGEKVIIMPGVHIGNKCIIGAGSIVTKNIPSYSLAVGNPARVIKKFDLQTEKWVKVNEEI